MIDRTKLLIHFRRISYIIEKAILFGPDGTLEGKFKEEHPAFIHYSSTFYLIGVLAYLAGENGEKSWDKPGKSYKDFDEFASKTQINTNETFLSKGVSSSSLNALVCIRNAVAHNGGDLSKNIDKKSYDKVLTAKLPGVTLSSTNIEIGKEFLEFVRVSALSVRVYHGEE